MATVSLSEMRTRTRELAGQETGAPLTSFVDTPELDRRINEALSAFHDLMVEIQRHEWVITPAKTHIITMQTSVTAYPVPITMLSVVGVRMVQGDEQFKVPAWDHTDRDWLTSSSELPYIDGYRYRVTGPTIELLPVPRVGYELHVDYIPEFAPLVNEDDEFTVPFGWEKWAALRAAIQMEGKRNTDTSQLQAEFAFEDRRIRALGGKRGSRGLRIVNTRRPQGHWGGLPRLWRDT